MTVGMDGNEARQIGQTPVANDFRRGFWETGKLTRP